MKIDRYQIQARIGQGDVGTVYAAYDPLHKRRVALKVMREDTDVRLAHTLMENEAAILALLGCPGVPAYYDFVQDEVPYLIYEHIPGYNLQQLIDGQRQLFSPSLVVRWGIQLCDTLTCVHHHPSDPIVVYDIKPEHLVVTRDNKVVLVDFSVAQLLKSGRPRRDAVLIGTRGFAPPEQYSGVATPLNDIYALGATLHYALTLRDPRSEPPFMYPPPSSLNPAVSTPLDNVILTALEQLPQDRYQSASVMKVALRACL